ncbi:MAG: penicillin-binding protein 2 [Patescibacteria group bacterium]
MKDNPFKIREGTVRDRRMKGFNASQHEGDNLLFMPDFSGWLGKGLRGGRFRFFYALLIFLFFTLFLRTSFLQIARGENYLAHAERNRTKVQVAKAPRGIMYDRFLRPLVDNTNQFNVYVNPLLIQSSDQARELSAKLGDLLPDQKEHIDSYVADYRRHKQIELIAENIPYEVAINLIIEAADTASILVLSEPTRSYRYPHETSALLGYIGKINEEELAAEPDYDPNSKIGKSGLEKSYEGVLKGVDGKVTTEIDAFGREKEQLLVVPARPGTDMILTIDLDTQQLLDKVLSRISEKNEGKPAAGVVMNPHNGEILALVSTPTYNANLFTTEFDTELYNALLADTNKPLFSRPLSGSYPPGSVFKLVVATAALNEGLINDRFTIQSTGGVWLGDRFFPDWRTGGHGVTDIYKAIADSVNSFFYAIGGGIENKPGLGVDMIERYARSMGFGAETGIDLPAESAGFVPSRKEYEGAGNRWYQGDTYNLSIGQGSLLVTPLQVARYTAIFANDSFVTPHVVRQIGASGNDTVSENDTQSFSESHGIAAGTIRIVRTAMRRTVTAGSATSLQAVPVAVAGKTGTAQFNRNKSPHSWFTGFAPFDEPQIVVTILVEEGGDQSYAVTAAREFLTEYFGR